MALFDFLKKKKEIEKSKKDQSIKKTEKVLDDKKTEKPKTEKVKSTKTKEKKGNFSYDVVREPHISEKSTYLGEKNQYVFRIYNNVNKPEIKKSVEVIYGVNVLSVNVIKIPKKKRRLGRTEGFKKGYSKAIVTIKEGQKIELF